MAYPIRVFIIEKEDFIDEGLVYEATVQIGSTMTMIRSDISGSGRNTKIIGNIKSKERALQLASNCIERNIRIKDISVYEQPQYFFFNKDERKNYRAASKYTDFNTYRKNHKKIVEFVEVKEPIVEGDIIALSKLNGSLDFPMIKVVKKNGAIGFSTSNMMKHFKHSFVALADIQDTGYRVSKILRKTVKDKEMKKYSPKQKEKQNTLKRPYKRGSIAGLYDSYDQVSAVYEYLESRREHGDIFLDQWMVDAYEQSQKTMKEIETLIKILKD